MKLPVPVQGSRMCTPGRRQRHAEFGVEHLVHAGAHEIDDGLRRVDDAVRVGHLDRVALEEALVDRVEEVLLVAEILQVVGGCLDGDGRSGPAT